MPDTTALDARIAKARAAGASWDQISGSLGQRVNAARAAGATEDQIKTSLGYTNPDEAMAPLKAEVQQNYATDPVKSTANLYDAFAHGLQVSSGGVLARGGAAPSQKLAPGFWNQLTSQAGELTGDLPAMTIGAVGGGAAGAAGGAAVPGAGETGGSEVVGGLLGGGAGSFALPTAIKQTYATGLAKGAWTGPVDFAQKFGKVTLETTKSAVTGAATSLAGGKITEAAAKLGAGPIAQATARITAELGTMTAANSAFTGKLPTKEDIIDGAAFLTFFHVAGHVSDAVTGNTTQNLAQHWADTGEVPARAASRAIADPPLRTKFQSTPELKPPPVSSETPISLGPVPAADGHPFQGGGSFVIPRMAGTYDEAAHFVMHTQEGGAKLVTDQGGLTKWGISSKANPDVDVRNLTEEQASVLLHDRYWKPIGADNLPDNIRLAAFDSAVNEGVGLTKKWLAESGGDLEKFMALRSARYAQLARDNPGVYGKDLAGWNNRLAKLGVHKSLLELVPENAAGGAAGGEPPIEPPAEPPHIDFEGDPWKAVASRFVDMKEGPSLWDKAMNTSGDLYREMFNPRHPIQQLVAAARKGEPIPDAENPEFAYRIAEGSTARGQYMIEHSMIDNEGNVVGPGLKKIIEPFKGDEFAKFWTYAGSRWAIEKAEQGKETGVEQRAAAQVVLEGAKQFEPAFKQLVEWQNGTLRFLAGGGVLSKEGLDASIAENKARIPGYREMDGTSSGGKGVPFNPVKKFLGSDRRIEPIFKSLVRDAMLRASIADRATADRQLADLASKHNLATRDTQQARAEFNLYMEDALKAHAGDETGDPLAAVMAAASKFGKDTAPVWRDGKAEAWKFLDPNVTKILRGYDHTTRSTWARMLGGMTNVGRKLIILNPAFPLHIMGYDIPWQFITGPGMRNTLADVYSGALSRLPKDESYKEWLRNGGADKIFQGLSKDEYLQQLLREKGSDLGVMDGVWNTVSTPFHFLRAWGQNLTEMQRLGRFKRGLQAGENPRRAAVAATEAMFHRPSATGPVSAAVNSQVPFFSAYIYSLEKVFRAQFGIGARLTGEKYNPVAFTAKAFAAITLPVLASWYANRDKNWYKFAPDRQKDNGILFHVGDDWEVDKEGHPIPHGHTLFYHLPPLVSLLYGGIPRRLMEAYIQHNPAAWDGLGESFGESLIPSGLVAPLLFQPIIEHMANHSFFRDQPLVNDDVRRTTMAPEQYTAYSTETSKAASRFINDIPLLKGLKVSPADVDNAINSWSGTLGRAAVLGVELATGAKGETAPAIHNPEDWPLFSSFLLRYPNASAQPIVDFEKRMDEFSQTHGSISRAIQSGDLARVQELVRDNPTAAAAHAYSFRGKPLPSDFGPYRDALRSASAGANLEALRTVLKTEKAMKQQRLFIARIAADDTGKFSPTDKRQLIDQTYAWMAVEGEHGLKALEETRAK